MTTSRSYIDVASPLGTLRLIAAGGALCGLRLPNDLGPPPAERPAPVDAAPPSGAVRSPDVRVLEAARRQLREYFEGRRQAFDLPLVLDGSGFQRRAWEALCRIPFGQTVSYGEQARAIARPKAARAVGAANGRNPIAIVVPCHRVIGSDGSLTGYGGGEPAKRWLLDHEARVLGARAPRRPRAPEQLALRP